MNGQVLRRLRLKRVTTITLIATLTAAVGMWGLTRHVVHEQENRAIDSRANDARAVLLDQLGKTESALATFALVAGITQNDPVAFQQQVAPYVTGSGVVALMHENADGQMVADVGSGNGFSAGTVIRSGPALQAASRILDTPKETGALTIGSTDIIRIGNEKRLGVAYRPPTKSGVVLYFETPLVPLTPSQANQQAFNDLSIDIYAGEPTPENQAFLTSTTFEPHGRVLTLKIDVGATQWTILATPKHYILGSLAHELPTMALGAGLFAAILIAALLETMARRRDYALALVKVRTSELEEARDIAIEASRLKSEFVANMSHEIRTPMNGVVGMTDLLLRAGLNEEQSEYANTIRTSAEALLNVINDILDFSKIEAGKLELESVEFRPREVAEEMGALLAGTAHAKGVELAVDVNDDVPEFVRGDAGRLRQILLNLVGNAVKFTEHGEVVIRVVLEESVEQQALLRFEVEDSGPGVSPENKERVFESFAQADSSTTRRHGGSGLGLAISRRLVELMGGTIGVTSELGVGSVFSVILPFAPCPRTATTAGPDLDGVPVLIVDDNATNRKILVSTLHTWGMKPAAVDSGRAGLDALRTSARAGNPFAVALLDYAMPEMDGVELAHHILDDPSLTATRLALLTSTGERGDLGHDQIDGFLTKPVRQAALRDCIAAMIGQKARVAPDSPPPMIYIDRPKYRILVAEDNTVNQMVARRMLESLGFEVDVVANGREAVQAAVLREYALVLMDCQMPEMDGYEATRKLRQTEGDGRRTPVVAMTASAMQGDDEKCFAAGMDGYLAKPVRVEELEQAVLQWAGGSRKTNPTS